MNSDNRLLENPTMPRFPKFWRYFLVISTVFKAAIAGGGLALASLGGLDIAFAISAQDWLNSIQLESYIDQFALGGGVAGAALQSLVLILGR